jgi:hypothetical protein
MNNKLPIARISICFIFALITISCINQTTTNQNVKMQAIDINPTGTYSATENGKPMQFVLENGGKGHENYKGKMRPFTWKLKGDKVFFSYDGEEGEWELPVNVTKGEITYGTLVYKKE